MYKMFQLNAIFDDFLIGNIARIDAHQCCTDLKCFYLFIASTTVESSGLVIGLLNKALPHQIDIC